MRVFRKNQLNKYQNKFESKSSILGKIIAVCLLTLVPLISPSAAQADDEIGLDPSFGGGGIVTTVINQLSEANSVVMQSDGKIVVAGYAYNTPTFNDFAVARYNSDGSLDTTFGIDGVVITHLGANDIASSVVMQSDNKIVVAGFTYGGIGDKFFSSFAVARYNFDGSLDITFGIDDDDGINGVVKTNIGSDSVATSVVMQSDGNIVVAGHVELEPVTQERGFVVARYKFDGSLDKTFGIDADGIDGVVISDIGENGAEATSVVLQNIGDVQKIVVAGYAKPTATNSDFAVVRYNSDGSLDTTFGDLNPEGPDLRTGVVISDLGFNDLANSVVLQTIDDVQKIIVAGSISAEGDSAFAVVRYNSDGSLDTTFGTDEDGIDGVVITPIGSSSEVYSVAMQSDGKIVAVGHSYNGVETDFAGARYSTDGLLLGVLTTNIDTDDYGMSVVLQSDGKIVVAGSTYDGVGGYNFAIVRYSSTTAPSDGDSDSSSPKTVATITPEVVKTAAGVFNLKNKTYLSKNDIKTKLSKNRSFKRNPEDLYKYSIFKASKKACIMRGNYVMALKKTGTCDLNVTRTTVKGAKFKYWVKINYSN